MYGCHDGLGESLMLMEGDGYIEGGGTYYQNVGGVLDPLSVTHVTPIMTHDSKFSMFASISFNEDTINFEPHHIHTSTVDPR